jgi:hypothetical protein
MSAAAGRPPFGRRLLGWADGLDDGSILRAAFFAMLAGTVAVLYIDYRQLSDTDPTALAGPGQPVLPAFDPDSPTTAPGPQVTTDFDTLKRPLSIALAGGGVLEVTGTIDPGSAERFAAEVAARGEYVQTVRLNSPGGSVTDALAIGALIREKGFATGVARGALCASSCPLVLAGGTSRVAEEGAAIGVHQIYATVAPGELPIGMRAAGDAMSDAQKTTARITRHLSAMGVDPALWLHALETPPDRLYYLSSEELQALRLVTEVAEL